MLLAPLHGMIKHGKRISKLLLEWKTWHNQTFDDSKSTLADATILAYPHPEANRACNASDTAIGAVLRKKLENNQQPVRLFSKKLTDAQRHYSTFSRELPAVHGAIRISKHGWNVCHS